MLQTPPPRSAKSFVPHRRLLLTNPTQIRLDRQRKHLTITWDDGATTIFPATLLRQRAKDAASVRRTVDGEALFAASALTIVSVEPVGNYAIQLVFSDGYDRGIFPWAYLAEISEVMAMGRMLPQQH